MSGLDGATQALVAVAAALYDAPEDEIARRFVAARAAGTSAVWLEELVLAAVLFVGFPRALVAAAALRRVEPDAGAPGDAADYSRWREWRARGEETCRRIYGANYEKLRRNLAAMHPALDEWIVTEGYGRAISRPGLDLLRRELCAIAMLVPQGVPRQLHSHLRGALNAGAAPADVEATLDVVASKGMTGARMEAARRLWGEMRTADVEYPTDV